MSQKKVLVIGKTYIIRHGGQRQKWDLFRIDRNQKGRKMYMGTTHRGILVAIINTRRLIAEAREESIFYSEWRAAGVEMCIACNQLKVANSSNFPMTYHSQEAKTIAPPVCIDCLRLELKKEDIPEKRKKTIRLAICQQLKAIQQRNELASY